MTESLPPLPSFEPGWVWLTGAGPGDPGLLTLHALHALRNADVVVYDALVSGDVLALARPGAALEFAGKRGGRPSVKQPDISRRLVLLASRGKRVLRLKGGDPLLFGRGGEEALALVEAGIPFRIVPGVSAALGGLAYAGIPLTHRWTNSTVTLVTAHGAGGGMPDRVDWRAVARGSGLIVVFMPLGNLERVTRSLIDAGRAKGEPAALVVRATTPEQKVIETTLAEAPVAACAAGLAPPALFVVGEAVRLRAGLDWLGALAGRTLEADPLGLSRESEAG